MRSLLLPAALLFSLLLPVHSKAEDKHPPLDYSHQEQWKGVLNHSQSPIDIVTATATAASNKESGALLISSKRAPSQVEDNGHAVQVDTDVAEALIRGRYFRLSQFHFHSPSEHTIDGKSYPLEGHFVFRAQDGRLAVVGVMFEEGAANAGIDPVLAQLGRPHEFHQAEVDISTLLPDDKSYYHYLGSLTTPPLTENVEWYVLSHPVTLSGAQLKELHDRHPRNNRQIQPVYGRPLIHYQSQ
ncbi:MAG: carbonic anhydrase [Pseudoxanthomonas sp.]